MEELEPTIYTVPYYRAFCDIGWKWIMPVQDQPFQNHKLHYLSAIQWCNDRDISNLIGDMTQHQIYVKRTTIMFTDEEDALAFRLAYGDLIIHFGVE